VRPFDAIGMSPAWCQDGGGVLIALLIAANGMLARYPYSGGSQEPVPVEVFGFYGKFFSGH